jgi:hypothetical protein
LSRPKISDKQGDQIGRIVVYWAIILSGQFLSLNFWTTYFQNKICVLMLTKMGWATFWAIFSQIHLVNPVTKLLRMIGYE